MKPEQFVYWLQGFIEIKSDLPTQDQWEIIKDHLQTVFKKETHTYSTGVTPGQIWTTPTHLGGDSHFIC